LINRREEFQGYKAVENDVLGLVDHTHPSTPTPSTMRREIVRRMNEEFDISHPGWVVRIVAKAAPAIRRSLV
jgi:hypothetical protein